MVAVGGVPVGSQVVVGGVVGIEFGRGARRWRIDRVCDSVSLTMATVTPNHLVSLSRGES